MIKGLKANIKDAFSDEFKRRRFMDDAQVVFVGAVWIAIFVWMFALSGCAENDSSPDATPKEKPPVPTQGPEAPPKVGFEVIPERLPKSGKYRVRLTWNCDENPQVWLIHRKEAGAKFESTQVAKASGTEREAYDQNVDPGKTYTYFLGAVNDPHYSLKAKMTVGIFQGEVPAKALENADRLYFENGVRVRLGAEKLTLSVGHLDAGDAVIETFPVGAVAAPGTNGRPAGSIEIKANSASGRLRIEGHGESGGAGPDGRNGRDGARGAQGNPGRYDVKPDHLLPMHKSPAEKEALKAYYANKTHNDPLARWDLWFHCVQQTGDGHRGERGENGQDGANGGNGGDSAKVMVQVAEESDFFVTVAASAGQGAIGGRGGNGGKGGPGGHPGPRDNGHLCREAGQGPSGEDGLTGRPGKFGENGKRQPVCVKVGSRVSGDCKP